MIQTVPSELDDLTPEQVLWLVVHKLDVRRTRLNDGWMILEKKDDGLTGRVVGAGENLQTLMGRVMEREA